MAVLSARQTQQFIMDYYLSDPELLPKTPTRDYVAGSAEADLWKTIGKARTPAFSRIERAFRYLENHGCLTPAAHPLSERTIVHYLSPDLVRAFENGVVRSTADLFGVSPQQAVKLRLHNIQAIP